jgi:4-oxalocrotonate tautomerase
MPIITLEGPRIEDLDRKRKFVKKLTDAAVEAYEIKDIIIIMHETTPDNVAVRGELIVDRMKK